MAYLLKEAESRGLKLPKEVANLVENKKTKKWPIAPNGFFIRDDGHFYEPSPAQEGFIRSTARNVMLYGPRGCLDGNTLVGGVPIAEKKHASKISTIYGDSWSSAGYNQGRSNLYSVKTEGGYRVSVTEHHRFLTPLGWRHLNQLSIGSLILTDGTLHEGNGWEISLGSRDHCSLDFHQCGELHALLVQASLDILQQLHRTDDDNNAQVSPFRLSIADSFSLLLYQLFLEYSVGLISFEQLSFLLPVVVQSLDKFFHSDTFLRLSREDESSWDYDYLYRCGYLEGLLEHGLPFGRKPQTGTRFESLSFHPGSSHTSVPNRNALEESAHEFLSTLAYPYEVRNEFQVFDTYAWLILEIGRTLDQLGSHFQSPVLFGQSVPTVDAFSLAELRVQYYRIWQLYKPVQLRYSKDLKSLVQSFLPEFFDVLNSNLLFSVYHSYDLLCSIDKNNSITRFDKIQNIKFERFGEYYDLSVLGTESYIANGIVHHNCGKSGAGSQKALMKIKEGEPGLIMNPDFENLKISTWPEFKRWIPWEMVVPGQRHRKSDTWEPSKPFRMVFMNGAVVYIKGGKEAGSTRGPNINWFWYDEGGRDDSGLAWQLANASVRIGHNPQAWCTETPRPTEHWSYKFFIEQAIPEEVKLEFEKVVGDDRILIEYFHATREDNVKNLDSAYYISLALTYPSGHLRAQEFDGEFANEGGKIGDRAWFDGKILPEPRNPVLKRVRFWDLAATEKKLVGVGKKKEFNDPDESVGSLVSSFLEERDTNWCIEDQVAGFWEWEGLLDMIVKTAQKDGPYVPIVLEEEPGSGGKNQVAAVKTHLKRFPDLQFHKVIGQRARDVGDRVMAANHWFALAAAGKMWMVKGTWNEKCLAQLDGFTQIVHDDRVTSITGAMTWIRPFKSWARTPFISL